MQSRRSECEKGNFGSTTPKRSFLTEMILVCSDGGYALVQSDTTEKLAGPTADFVLDGFAMVDEFRPLKFHFSIFWDGSLVSFSSFLPPALQAQPPLLAKPNKSVHVASKYPQKSPIMPPKRVKKVMTMPINVIFGHLQVRKHMLCREVSCSVGTHNLCGRVY